MSTPVPEAEELVQSRRAEVIRIVGADQFFGDLLEKVRALGDLSRAQTIPVAVAVATLKRYLIDPAQRIRLSDLVSTETEALIQDTSDVRFPVNVTPNAEQVVDRLRRYDRACEMLVTLLATGSYWAENDHARVWSRTLERLDGRVKLAGGLTALLKLRRYPVLLSMYAAGIGAVAGRRYSNLYGILVATQSRGNGNPRALVTALDCDEVMDMHEGRKLPGMERHYTPLNDWIFAVLRPVFRDVLPDDDDYEITFDRFEYLSALVCHDVNVHAGRGEATTRGPYLWRGGHGDGVPDIAQIVDHEMAADGEAWGPITAGFFGGLLSRASASKLRIDGVIQSHQR